MAEITATKAVHDLLMADRPAGAEHPEDCVFCAMEDETTARPEGEPGGEMAKTYTEEEVRAAAEEAVKKAVAPVQAELDALREEKETDENEAALDELRETLEGEKAAIQAKLDEAVLEAANAKQAHDDLVAWLEDEGKKAEEAAAVEARREERLATAKAAAEFPEDFQKYLDDNADRIAAMSDEEFTARVTEWAALAGGKVPAPAGGGDGLPDTTALHAAREGREDGKPKSAVKELFAMRREGVDPRTL